MSAQRTVPKVEFTEKGEPRVTLRAGARGSALAVAQTERALAFLRDAVPEYDWARVAMLTPGDRDLATPLERSAPDFFTRDLDDAVRSGEIDCAIHSAKDVPDPVPDGLDWFWLPEREDPRDALVTRANERTPLSVEPFAPNCAEASVRIGISSDRRRAWAAKCFPAAQLVPIRGAIDARLEQLRAGKYDAVVMALAGLNRLLGFSNGSFAIEPIPVDELAPPEGQGVLAVTFKAGDERFLEMRKRFVKAVRFVSGGVGDSGLMTVQGAADVAAADVVLCDVLTGARAADTRFVDVGKRCGAHAMKQDAITCLICDEARKGKRVVRLKGGDAGLFGRLSEETDALNALGIPFWVRPGVSALTAATTPNGLLLTKRGEAAGFAVATPRSQGAKTPHIYFMATKTARETLASFPAETPFAMVWDACGPHEEIVTGVCGDPRLDERAEPGLLVVDYAGEPFPRRKRVLMTCSATMMARAALKMEDRGWRPVPWSMVETRPDREARFAVEEHDALVLTSPGAVRAFFATWKGDVRRLPAIWTCGPGTNAELAARGIVADVTPETDFSAKGLLARLAREPLKGVRVLRLRSDRAGGALADALRERGAEVDDVVLYRTCAVRPEGALPACEAVFFASSSGVASFLDAYGAEALAGKELYVMGEPTRASLAREWKRGRERGIMGAIQIKEFA